MYILVSGSILLNASWLLRNNTEMRFYRSNYRQKINTLTKVLLNYTDCSLKVMSPYGEDNILCYINGERGLCFNRFINKCGCVRQYSINEFANGWIQNVSYYRLSDSFTSRVGLLLMGVVQPGSQLSGTRKLLMTDESILPLPPKVCSPINTDTSEQYSTIINPYFSVF